MPPKAAWLDLAKNPTLEFEFFLAEKLGRTVTELRETVAAWEFVYWVAYYRRQKDNLEMEYRSRGK